MSYAKTLTTIPIQRVADVLQIDPWHFNSVYTDQHPVTNACDDVWYQHNWQSAGKISREDMAMALRQAEDLVTERLGWFFLPKWITEETKLQPHYRTELYNFANSRGERKSVITKWGKVYEVGARANTLIEADAAVSFEDDDGDTFDEIMQVVVATTVTDPEEIRVYYPEKEGKDVYEIRPIDVSISGGIATIKFPKYLGVLETLLEYQQHPAEGTIAVSGDDNTNFLQTVDVYRVYTDTSTQMVFHNEDGCYCDSGICEFCDETGCLLIRDKELGIIAYRRATWDEDTEEFVTAYHTYAPHKATIYYRAGLTNSELDMPTRQVDPAWERMVIFFALSFLDTEMCGCSNTKRIVDYQLEDLALSNSERSYSVSWDALDNPFGTTRAAMALWKRVYAENARMVRSQPSG